MSTEITINQDIVEINVTETVVVVEAPSGAYPLPTGVFSVFGRTGNVVAAEGDYTLTQLAGVTITSPSSGQALVYNGTSWVNNTESFVGTVTNVSALTIGTTGTDLTSSVVNSTTTPVITLNVPTASATNRGALSSTDWSTFNAKQVALNGTGFVKISGTTISYDNSTYYLASNPSSYIPLTALSSTATGLTYTNTTGVFSTTAGYAIPTTAKQTTWDTAYNDSIVSAAVTGTTTKTLALNQQDGGTISASWTDDNTDAVTSVFGRIGAITAQNGDYTTTQVTEGTNLYYTDARSRTAISETVTGLDYNNTTGVFSTTSGYGIPTTASQTNWDAAYNDKINSASVTGTSTKTLTLNQQDGGTITASWSDIDTGLTSVGLSMPAAFSVSGSPLTSNGTISVTGSGVASQYVRGDGSLANFPTSSGGGSSVAYYFNSSVSQGTLGGVAYRELSKVPIIGAGTDITIATNGYIASYITDANDPALLEIPAGNWNFEMYFSASFGGGSPSFYVQLYKYDGTTFTLISSSSATPEVITNGTAIDLYNTALAVPLTTLTLTDRLAIRVYVNNSGRTITLHTENSHLCEVITTFSSGISALNGLTNQVQYLATGTSGTDFNISSATDTHTFNLPTASGSNTGKLSSSDWTTFNNKQPLITAGTTLQYYRGDKTFQTLDTLVVPENTNLYYTQARFDTAFGNKNTTNLAEGTNLYYTDTRARAAITGTLPISVTSGVVSISQASGSSNGYLSSTDFTTFNNKQDYLSGTGFVKSTAGVISYDTNTYLTTISGIAAGGELSGTYANPTLVNSAVIGKVLTGLNLTGGGTIADTDSILGAFGKVQNQISALVGGVMYEGTWNASTNTPTITSSVGSKGDYYIVATAGNTNINGITSWNIGDWIIFNGSTWDKVDNTDAVSSVNGYTGAVSLVTSDVPESGSLYFTNARAIGSTLTGYTSGSGVVAATDTILQAIQKLNGNVSGLVTGVSSVFGRSGAVVATNGDYNTSQVTENTNLYYTEARVDANTNVAANTAARHAAVTLGTANGLSLSTQALSLGLASGSLNGALSSTDWNTFNNKQATLSLTTTGNNGSATLVGATLNVPTYTLAGLGGQTALNGTGFVKISGTTISYDNSTYLTTSSASSTYLPLAGGTLTGPISGTSATFSGQLVFPTTSKMEGSVAPNFTLASTSAAGSGVGPYQIFKTNGSDFGYIGAEDALMSTTGNKLALLALNGLSIRTGASYTERLLIASTGAATFSSILGVNGAAPSTPFTTNFWVNGSGGAFVVRNNGQEAYLVNTSAGYFGTTAAGSTLYLTSGAGTNTMVLSGSGNVGIGFTGYSSTRLAVRAADSSSSNYGLVIETGGGFDAFTVRNDGLIGTGNRSASPYNNSTTGRSMVIESNGSLGYLVSTRESKSNIESIKNVDFINHLNPVQFNYRKKDDKTNEFTDELYENTTYGFIADEVEKVNKDLVFYKEDGITLAGVEYNNMIAILTKAVQEQQAQIEELKALINK